MEYSICLEIVTTWSTPWCLYVMLHGVLPMANLELIFYPQAFPCFLLKPYIKAVTQFCEVEWWKTLMVECVTVFDYLIYSLVYYSWLWVNQTNPRRGNTTKENHHPKRLVPALWEQSPSTEVTNLKKKHENINFCVYSNLVLVWYLGLKNI